MRKSHDVSITDSPAIAAQLSTLPLISSDGKVLLPPKSLGYLPTSRPLLPSRPGKVIQPKPKTVTLQNLQDKLKRKDHSLSGEALFLIKSCYSYNLVKS